MQEKHSERKNKNMKENYMNKLKYLYYFFFPPSDRIWLDGASGAFVEDGKLKVLHKHYTFRNLAVHWFHKLFIIPFEDKKREELIPRLAFAFAQLLFFVKFNVGYEVGLGWFIGAIAYDNATGGGNTDTNYAKNKSI